MALTQHMLVGTDFSPASVLGLDLSCELAKLTGARITLAHVYLGAPAGLADRAGKAEDEPCAIEESLTEDLERLRRERLGDLAEVALRLINAASPADALCRYASDHDIDLIVVSSHGRTGLAHLLIGSVAEKTVRHSPCPVVVAR
ncbi:MAG: universal stress protein [Proteobacteria bacterium]|nr:universal stress protein [Pseudomonadota bacterium]